jgi:Fur family zinc uptake transcriptional regulator
MVEGGRVRPRISRQRHDRLDRVTTKAEQQKRLAEMEALCRERGGRLTPQRRSVLEKLLVSKRPQSAYELRDILLPQDPSITPASVYRCLDFLMEKGLIHRLETTRSFVACDHPQHAHTVQFLICRQCGTVLEAEDKRVSSATSSLGSRLGFEVDHRTVELTGVCADCQTGSPAQAAHR